MAYMAVEAYCGQPIEYADIWFPVDASPVYKPLRKPSNNVSLSLSHSKGGVVVAASLRGALGVDVLDHDRPRNWRSIALNYFPKVDVDYLQSLPEDKAIAAFRQLWCWKEALVKAAGLSLVEALHFPFMEPDGVPCKIMWGATSFYLRADVHAGYTVGLLTEEAFEYQVLATTPKKILASLVQAGQS
jgi:phosphopantetheinyl transferase (holo-ACP synthase)